MLRLALSPVLAQTDTATAPWHPHSLPEGLLSTTLFGGLGIVLLLLGIKVFEWITPRVDLEKELAEKNLAVGVVVGALVIAIGYIIARTIAG